MNAAAIIAAVSAAVSVVVVLSGIWERHRAFEAQKEALKEEAARWRADFQKDFQLELYRNRLASYAGVLKTLGAVPDVALPGRRDLYRTLDENRELLTSTAEALYDHLYGEPGLLMTMQTRNVLHSARRQIYSFLDSDGSEKHGRDLVSAFFDARRYLRADLELLDDRSSRRLRDLVDELAAETPAGPL